MQSLSDPALHKNGRFAKDKLFVVLCITAAALSIAMLFILLTSIGLQGKDFLTWDFLTNSPSRKPVKAGIFPAMMGTIFVCGVCAFTAIPIGVGTAILLEEFKPRNKYLRMLHGIIQLNITNLAGVPSIVYGILGMTAFALMFNFFKSDFYASFAGEIATIDNPAFELGTTDNWYYLRFPFGRSVLAGGLTLMLVILPIIIISAQEALRAVPGSLRHGALALGCTRWQTVWSTSLPAAIPGIMTGTILAMSRAIGEAAPLLIIASLYLRFTPGHLMDDFSAMPLQIFNWAGRPQADFHYVAASGIIVLLIILLSFNAIAITIRQLTHKPMS
ncbi:Phosphate transport system permease protein PstA [Poriferisphaera corsica]|uniref:Phosphate transport system permease protein PstA n=1 Tax=Poriferisphaera corsica TaxID=2528020 RepID=A0A517YRH9_9BACT|nr:ABC transporter permease subunit [Poriferisphaera corsica]QDU32801.1 Phosphate transport system permease protein PstA [Poriferisphaera corsica]